jgi:hypothetical protein
MKFLSSLSLSMAFTLFYNLLRNLPFSLSCQIKLGHQTLLMSNFIVVATKAQHISAGLFFEYQANDLTWPQEKYK